MGCRAHYEVTLSYGLPRRSCVPRLRGLLQRCSNTLRFLWPEILIATRSVMPRRTVFRTAERRKSWSGKPGSPAAPTSNVPRPAQIACRLAVCAREQVIFRLLAASKLCYERAAFFRQRDYPAFPVLRFAGVQANRVVQRLWRLGPDLHIRLKKTRELRKAPSRPDVWRACLYQEKRSPSSTLRLPPLKMNLLRNWGDVTKM